MINTLLIPELREMLATGDEEGLREFATALHPARAAEFMEGLTPEEAWGVLRTCEPHQRAEIFGYFTEPLKIQIVESGDPQEISTLVADLPADDRVDLINDVSPAVADEVLPLLPAEERRETIRLREFAEGTAGSVMTTEVARLRATLTVREALELISRQSQDLETVYYNYVVDDDDRLLGLVSARQLVVNFTRPDTPISDLMQRDVVTVFAADDQETVAAKVANFDFLAIPVVDDQQHLLGIITHDDIIDVLREEATEDAHKSAGVDPLDDGYLETHWFTLAWKRGIWLGLLFIASLMTAVALENYLDAIEAVPWLLFFIPLVISSGGNSGSQSATLVITAMNHGEVKLVDWWRVMRRELVMGLCLGGVLAAVGYLSSVFLLAETSTFDLLVIPVTIIMVVICGTLCGGMLPLIFRRLGLDPALMSNPFVTGIIDIAGIVIYMNVAMRMLAPFRS